MTVGNGSAVPEQADVVVVGGGGSGLSAAIAAAEQGAKVVLLEKNPATGGSTGMSVGSFSAAGTSLQRRRGVSDSPEEFEKDMVAANGDLEQHENPELRSLLVHGAAETFERLRRLHVQFLGPMPEPPYRNPRMHNIVPSSRGYVRALTREALRQGVHILCDARVERLTVGQGGRVSGVEGSRSVRATRAVVLTTGDYSADAELKARWVSEATSKLPPINPASTGDGFRMAMELGAATRNTWRTLEQLRLHRPGTADRVKTLPTAPMASWGMRVAIERLPKRVLGWFARSALTSWVSPSAGLFEQGAVAVNARGERFADEFDRLPRAMGTQAENKCYIVFDARIARLFEAWPHPVSTFPGIAYAYLGDYERFRPDAVHKAPDLDRLAGGIGADRECLRRSIEDWNRHEGRPGTDAFGRKWPEHALDTPPFYALGPLGGFVTITDGGLDLDGRCRVKDEDAGVIPGLYAAGSTGQGGLILANHGLHLAWAMTSGRIAGQQAARDDAT